MKSETIGESTRLGPNASPGAATWPRGWVSLYLWVAVAAYLSKRWNGIPRKGPPKELPTTCKPDIDAALARGWVAVPGKPGYYQVIFTEGPATKAFVEAQDRKYLSAIAESDPVLFLKELTPREKLDTADQEKMLGLDLSLPHHQNLQREYAPLVARLTGVSSPAAAGGGAGSSAASASDELSKLKAQMAEWEARAKRTELEEKAKREALEEKLRLSELAAAELKAKPVSAPRPSFSIIPYEHIKFTGKILGDGGFGIVSEATWQYTPVAVKQFKALKLSDDTLEELKSEAEHHGALRHPNIVGLYGVCLEPAKYCLVMELMLAGSLYELLHNGQALPWALRLSIAKDIAIGLNYLHEQKIIHRDIKSLNVLLTPDGSGQLRAKLTDFGLSKVKTESALVSTSGAVGSKLWMAPELFKRGSKYTEQTDFYALGVVFWELASRELPFVKEAHGDIDRITEWVKSGEREEIPAATPPRLKGLIASCWSAKIEERPKSAKEIIDELMKESLDGGAAASGGGSGSGGAAAAAASLGFMMFSH